jgi:hypothetical protein
MFRMAYHGAVARLSKSQLAMLCLTVCVGVAQSNPRSVTGTYRNPALGYSINVPPGLKGIAGDQAGPERGLRISLPSGGKIAIFGEPNSLEWKSPEQGVRSTLAWQKCASRQQEVSAATVGKLRGAKGALVCGDSVLKVFLVFRPGGGPIYWLQLETASADRLEDESVLERVAASFSLIPWT